ncbi:TIGR00341 family protein [Heliobacterium undosum]|uniref:TIGR00341 family protein n=1 Tax=Heliomicrobium undosum TaxID=121734 RepID=A0A845L6E4_9FIRM|nr:TIGR00341 family protein [Heliomicrobium undosum]MZP30404.1 TIGR00341 family protein [Heliomicrobium undosum]
MFNGLIDKLPQEKMQAIYDANTRAARADGFFYLMVCLSGTVATLGLLTNSAAVIIGAMLLAPLMNPIVAGALAMTIGDTQMLRRSAVAELSGVILAVVLSTFITLISPTRELTPEILARTQPTLFDLLIAFASGAAGAYTLAYRPESSALPGVAIATALMPPLCVVGIGFASYDYSVVWGGFLLFLANLIAINLASFIVFRLAGFTTHYGNDESFDLSVRQRLLMSAALFVLISLPLVSIMLKVIDHNNLDKLVRESLTENLQIVPRSELVSYKAERNTDGVTVSAVVRTPGTFKPEQIRDMENVLEYTLKAPVEVHLQTVRVAEVTRHRLFDVEHPLPGTGSGAVPAEAASGGASDSPAEGADTPALSPSASTQTVKLNNPEKLIEDILVEKSRVSPGFLWQTFSFSYDREKAAYDVRLLMQPQAEWTGDLPPLLAELMEERLKRKVNLTVEKPKAPEAAAPGTPGEEPAAAKSAG